jgi:hypothetical protein
MFKFINDKDNAPSFHTASFDFDHEVNYENEYGLTTHVNLACTYDNIPVVFLNSFGLRYKHSDKFSISISEGTIHKHISNPNPQNDGQSDFLYLSSPTGKIKITDTFKNVFISWQTNDQQVQITTSDSNDSVIIDFQKGVIDPNIKQYFDFLLKIYETTPPALKPSMWKKILGLKTRFGITAQ